jgi:hypothetical protein
VDRRDPLPALFADDEVVTFSSTAEMRALSQHYLARPSERQAIAARAESRARRDHTYDRRVGVILDDNLPPHLRVGATATFAVSLDDAIATAAASATLSMDEAIMRIVADVRDTVATR